jgi:YD repeat-containing protein
MTSRLRVALAVLTVSTAAALLGAAAPAMAAVSCPNSNPVVNENNCMGAGSQGWRIGNYSEDIAGYTTKTSFAKGENVQLKIARNAPILPQTHVDISVYRTGYYGGEGARLIPGAGATNVAVNNNFTCNPANATTGELSCANWGVTFTIPGSALPASGVYVAKLRTTDTNVENRVVFVVRDDGRVPEARVLLVLPTTTYLAYNTWGGKSLYFDKNGGANTVSGTPRAVKVSFDRPLDGNESDRDRYFGPDFQTVQWLEQQGYDVAYTDDVRAHVDPAELLEHKVLVIPGHSEYWSREEFLNFKAARDAGVNIASFSANTSYWKVRYENATRSIVCFKTVQGDGSSGSGRVTPNDWGPDGVDGTADDALGADGRAGTADDHPENSTTTFRDNGALPGDINAPPAGRVGPDMPENQLFGVMYVGDNDNVNHPLTVPAGNANGEYAADSTWRRTGLPTNTQTSIGTGIVGWEWDAVPTQAQYLSRQPAGVKRLSASDTTSDDPSWIQDEGRLRSTVPPLGQPGTVNAVRYTAASGARVFAGGTNQWGWGLSYDPDPRIQQATYNIFADMGVQPVTPDGISLDPTGGNQSPTAAFSVSPTPVRPNQPATFNASASSDPNGTIAKYEWDFDGDGTYEVDAGTSATITHTYTTEDTFTVRLRVTDNNGATDLTARSVEVIANYAPTAALTAMPNPVVIGQTVTFNGSGSSDQDGTIAKYEWDLDANGSFERDTGGSATVTTTYATAATRHVVLRVTDNGGKTGTATLPVTVNSGGVSNYGDGVLDTPGLTHYWRLGESSGSVFADSKGTAHATAGGGFTLGVPGGVAFDPNRAARFDGTSGFARSDFSLAGTDKLTIEFWANWRGFNDDDSLAFEYTNNFNQNAGGFLIDPDAPQQGGKFGVALGSGTTRNNAFFTRPAPGTWHHYAIIFDTSAPAAQQITPYMDGAPVPFTKTESGTGAGNFADASLYFMSRAGIGLFGDGDLDEVAVYDRPLSAATISDHYSSYGTNRRPVADFAINPNPVKANRVVTFDGSPSTDPDGTLHRYEWDLDGNGTYETDGGSNPIVQRTFATEQNIDIKLRVTDDMFGTDTQTKTLKIGNQAPDAAFTATPNPGVSGQLVHFDASATQDVDGFVDRYEWDLDGNGTFETNTGTTKTTSQRYTQSGTVNVGLRATDDEGKASTVVVPVTINDGGISNYGDSVLDTSGLVGYWRMGEAAGPTFADSKGANHATAFGGTTFGVTGAVAGDPDKAGRFDGIDDYAKANVDLSGTSAATVEFWLKWTRHRDEDALAMEFTPNFNGNTGGFLVDPDSAQFGGTFGVGLGQSDSRNNAFFARPSVGQWHHYALVLDATKPAATQITPYVDGRAVSYQKLDSGTGAGHFANSVLNFMSRNGTGLFGQGDLDEVAVFDRALSAGTIADHYASSGTNRRPHAAFSISPNPAKPGQTVTFDATASSDPDGTIQNYEWDLDGDGTYEREGASAVVTRSYASETSPTVKLRVTDDRTGTDTETHALEVANKAPVASFTAAPNPALVGDNVAFNASASSDPDGTVTRYEWDLDGNGTYETDGGTSATTSHAYSVAASVPIGLRVTDNEGRTGTTTVSVRVRAGSYPAAVLGTTGLVSYWRLGETTGTQLADSKGNNPATLTGGATLGATGGVADDPDTSVSFDGFNDAASATVNLSGSSAVTVEFWLKWDGFVDNDQLAMELTDNFNQNAGGFLVDPNASNGEFGVAIGNDDARNNAYFTRPSAAQWHHYAFVLDSTAPAATQVVPYVDGVAVPYIKGATGTGAGHFANAALHFMSRSGQALFGGGDLDEVAVYDRALSAATIAAHRAAGAP